MRNRQDDYRDHNEQDARWLHNHHSGQRSDRGNYNVDTNFNRGYGSNAENDWTDTNSFNANADQDQMARQGRFGVGGARYSGQNFAQDSSSSDNMYGMTFSPRNAYNSGRHYDPRADYSNSDYSDRGDNSNQRRDDYGMPNERFGHDVSQGNRSENQARGSRGDYESYRRYEQNNRMYDDDYSGGFAGRNYSEGQTHYGEGSHNSNLDRWNQESENRNNR